MESDADRLGGLVNEQVFTFARQAQQRYKSDDLVVILDLTTSEPELVAVTRAEMASSTQLPARLRAKLSKPASAAAKALKSPQLSFWFVTIEANREGLCVALNASMLSPGGTA